MHHISRRGAGLLFAALALVLLPGTAVAGNVTGINVTVPNAKAAITGKITRHGGGAIKGALVELVDPTFGFPSDYTTTDSSGKFTFYDKSNASFLLLTNPHPGAPTYVAGYYRKTGADHFTTDKSTASQIHYTNALISGVNVAVPLGHSIKGHVHRQKNGAPLKGVTVSATPQSSAASYVGGITTDASGNYTIPGLANGSYQLTFTPKSTTNTLTGCYRSAAPHNYTADCSGHATSVAVHNADVANKNTDLPDGHLITGKVKDAQGHNLCATVSAQNTSNFGVASQTTACGSFTLMGLATGDYQIDIARNGTSHFVDGFYSSNAHHWVETGFTAVHVGNANVNLATIQPDPGHIISGTIKNAANQPVHNASVGLYGSGTPSDFTSTDTHGNFTFYGVGNETHTITETVGSSGQNMLSGYYRSGATGNWTGSQGQATALAANANHTGIVIKPPKGFTISGRITNSAHNGVSSFVSASGDGSGFAISDAQGNFVMGGLAAGDYTITVSPGSTATTHYRYGYYDKTAPGHFTSSYGNASSVHVGP